MGWESEREGVRKIQRNSAERRRDVNVHTVETEVEKARERGEER
jgi:hypothetical protein